MTLTVPTSTVSDLANATSFTFNSLFAIVILMISVPVAFYIMRRILAMFPKPRSR